jgi:hypothetical protein
MYRLVFYFGNLIGLVEGLVLRILRRSLLYVDEYRSAVAHWGSCRTRCSRVSAAVLSASSLVLIAVTGRSKVEPQISMNNGSKAKALVIFRWASLQSFCVEMMRRRSRNCEDSNSWKCKLKDFKKTKLYVFVIELMRRIS